MYNYKRGKCIVCGKRTSHRNNDGLFACTTCDTMGLEDTLNFEQTISNKSVNLNIRHENSQNKIDIICFGDWHYGDMSCNVAAVKNQIEWIKNNSRARVILMGDILNCGTKKSIGAGTFQDNRNPQQQYDDVIEMLKPIKDKLYGVHIGNHEQRILNETGINLSKMMAKELNTKYLGYSSFHSIKVGEINYSFFTTHGSSGATLPHTKIKRCLDLAAFIDADIYCMGHVHALQVLAQEYKKINLKNKVVQKDKKYFVLTGHYLQYEDSYADMKSMRPSKQGCARIRLDGLKKDIHVSV